MFDLNFLLLHFLLLAVICYRLGVQMHRIMDKDPKTLWRDRLSKRAFLMLFIVFVALMLTFVIKGNIDDERFMNYRQLDLILGLMLTSTAFFVPSRANTFKPGFTKFWKVRYPKIKVAGWAAFILGFGGFVNSVVILLFDLGDSYINLLAQAVFFSSTIIAIGGQTVRTVTVKNRVHHEITRMGQIAIIVLLAGLSVKVVDEYQAYDSNAKSEAKLNQTAEHAEKANALLGATMDSLEKLDIQVNESIKNLTAKIPDQEKIMTGQENILKGFPNGFKTNFDKLYYNLDTIYFKKISDLQISIDTALDFGLEKQIQEFNTSALDALRQTLSESVNSYNHFTQQYAQMIGTIDSLFRGERVVYKNRIYFEEDCVKRLNDKINAYQLDSAYFQMISSLRDATGKDTLVLVLRSDL